MNLERLEQAIAIMKRAGRFNIEKWQYNKDVPNAKKVCTEAELHTCGSAACFGGWIAVSSEWQQVGGTIGQYGEPVFRTDTDSGCGDDALSLWLNADPRIIHCIVFSELGVNTLLWDKESGGTFSIFYDKATADVTPTDVIKKLEAYRTHEGIVQIFSEYLQRYKVYYQEYTDNKDQLAEKFGLHETVTADDANRDFNNIQYVIDDFSPKKGSLIMTNSKRIVLKYNNPKFASYNTKADVFVALDERSGGYPYQTTLEKAQDFKTIEAAVKYASNFEDFSVIEVTVVMTEVVIIESTLSNTEREKQESKKSIERQIEELQNKLKEFN